VLPLELVKLLLVIHLGEWLVQMMAPLLWNLTWLAKRWEVVILLLVVTTKAGVVDLVEVKVVVVVL